jgi:patatin-related protein
MHGITKELEKLVRASDRLVAAGDPTALNPFQPNETEHAYFEALRHKATVDGYFTRVVVDIISGTSAGGINGVCLAKAVAQDAPQDGLRDLWLKKGAIGKLIGVGVLPPLAGNRMLGWVRTAFADMDAKRGTTLMPAGLMLQLFVTTTDIHGYARGIPIADPKQITTVVNKHVFEFRHRDDVGNLDESHNPALGFSARATSSFPGAFAPAHIGDIEPQEARDAFPGEFCHIYGLNKFDVTKTFFIDGGVLDNFPFRHAVRAIPGKPAATEVDRKLLFIEPDPAPSLEQPDGISPSFKDTVWSGLSKLPRRQPIADAFDELMLYNQRVREIKQMTGTLRQQIFDTVVKHLGQSYEVANKAVNDDAVNSNPFAFQAYLHVKLLSVVEGMATTLCDLLDYSPASTQALFVRQALLRWAARTQILEPTNDVSESQRAFLRTFDLGYGRRRLGFVIRRASEFYGADDRAALNELKHGMYKLLCELQSVFDRSDAEAVKETADKIFNRDRLEPYLPNWRVDDFLDDVAGEIADLRGSLGAYLDNALSDYGERAYQRLQDLTTALLETVRNDIRAHYLGFVYWDAATYAARRVSGIVELDEVEVFRASPLDAKRLPVPEEHGFMHEARMLGRGLKRFVLRTQPSEPEPRTKLRGVKVAHFGAFFFRKWRENDYLWGRLDGAERLLGLIDESDTEFAKQAFRAIVDDEKEKLRKAKDVIRIAEDYVKRP